MNENEMLEILGRLRGQAEAAEGLIKSGFKFKDLNNPSIQHKDYFELGDFIIRDRRRNNTFVPPHDQTGI